MKVNSGLSTSIKRGRISGGKGYPKWVEGHKQNQRVRQIILERVGLWRGSRDAT